MIAVNGFYEDGRFVPLENVELPKRAKAVLLFHDTDIAINRKQQPSWLMDFHAAVRQSAGEDLPDFPRAKLGRMVTDAPDEE